jgi:hypothetical protein
VEVVDVGVCLVCCGLFPGVLPVWYMAASIPCLCGCLISMFIGLGRVVCLGCFCALFVVSVLLSFDNGVFWYISAPCLFLSCPRVLLCSLHTLFVNKFSYLSLIVIIIPNYILRGFEVLMCLFGWPLAKVTHTPSSPT